MLGKYFTKKEYLKVWLPPFAILYLVWVVTLILSLSGCLESWFPSDFDYERVILECYVFLFLCVCWIILYRYEKTFEKRPLKTFYVLSVFSILYIISTLIRIFM